MSNSQACDLTMGLGMTIQDHPKHSKLQSHAMYTKCSFFKIICPLIQLILLFKKWSFIKSLLINHLVVCSPLFHEARERCEFSGLI